jgi:hypothetical protein
MVARLFEPSMNVTVPVGVPAPGPFAETVAVNVTVCPGNDGFTEETTAVLLPSLVTVCVSTTDVLAV